ncbi:MAG TPA: (2Fe-2S) ferredoxin domain-containing protein [Treponemataceae bacterium]|jgi:NADH:ubiquinone oxidoreductase subunit E|nr:(2Fe-2S) ferredoxin domain-containing protein [Treponema sp.]HOF84435.1 (2Fe-2S) ferredoxin domain-containing protein [Treponemataceae bacterium]HOS36221.1 (2Fe-2S) ferredoxin domain-containing protein [Treponemataceae bacterium]HOU37530.1 (2Fe-2S) ferredoxin domain-containing protein [Treponemataceae bacterium]HPX13165.1 (2Fe-2S) ferredoxin domain-containing protein [Treponemataceae bacterium]
MESKKRVIRICMGSSCYSRGNGQNAELLQHLMDTGTLDGDTVVSEVSGTLCEGLCREGPIVIIDEVVHRQVTPILLADLLAGTAKE